MANGVTVRASAGNRRKQLQSLTEFVLCDTDPTSRQCRSLLIKMFESNCVIMDSARYIIVTLQHFAPTSILVFLETNTSE